MTNKETIKEIDRMIAAHFTILQKIKNNETQKVKADDIVCKIEALLRARESLNKEAENEKK